MSIELDIRQVIADFVTGQIDLGELQDDLAPLVWDAEDSGDESTKQLTYTVQLELAEHLAAHRTDREFRLTMERLVLYPTLSTSSSTDAIDDTTSRSGTECETEYLSSTLDQ